LSFEKAAALAAGFLEPDVVVFERVVGFCFELAIHGIDDAAVGRESESGDFFVDALKRLVEILRERDRRKKEKRIYTERTENAEGTEKREPSGHGLGCVPV
jgi:hypothetical protein